MNWCILIPLIVGLLSALLGYLLGKLLSSGNTNQDAANINMWRDKSEQLEADLTACKAKLSAGAGNPSMRSNSVDNTSSFAAGAVASIVFDAAAAKAAFGKSVKQDDLKIIEGIGPKIAELFNNDGLTTWQSLGDASVSRLQAVLDAQGERYKVHNPETWPMQSKMAYQGKWSELKKWQDEHDYGKK